MSEHEDKKKTGNADSNRKISLFDANATRPVHSEDTEAPKLPKVQVQELEWNKKLYPHWERLDAWSDLHSPHPSQAQIQQILLQAKRKNRGRLWKELLGLWSIALLLVGGGCGLAAANWQLYAWVQVFLLSGAVIIWLTCFHPSRESEQHE